MLNSNTIAEQLKHLRAVKRVTQDDIAELLNVKRQTYSAYERGVSVPDAITLKILADYFGVTADYIVGEPNTDTPAPNGEKRDTPGEVSDDDIRFALFGGDSDDITDEMFEDVKRFAQFLKEKKKSANDGTN